MAGKSNRFGAIPAKTMSEYLLRIDRTIYNAESSGPDYRLLRTQLVAETLQPIHRHLIRLLTKLYDLAALNYLTVFLGELKCVYSTELPEKILQKAPTIRDNA